MDLCGWDWSGFDGGDSVGFRVMKCRLCIQEKSVRCHRIRINVQ